MVERRQLVIIGAGPAGIAATIFLRRAGFDPLLLEKGTPGGLVRQANLVENYPGFPKGISGPDLADLLCSHLRAVGGVVTRSEVNVVKGSVEGFLSSSSEGDFLSDAVIVATGTKPKRVAMRGLEGDLATRVHYDINGLVAAPKIDGPVVVYGGGDAAFDQGISLSRKGYPVALVSRSESRCLPLLKEKAREEGVAILEGLRIDEARAGRYGIELVTSHGTTIDASHMVIACGREPCLELLDASIRSQIREDELPRMPIPGLFLAGDVAAGEMRQVGIAVGSGMSAAMSAERFLRVLVPE